MKTISKSVILNTLIMSVFIIFSYSCTPEIGITEKQNIKMVSIPSGKYNMGSPEDEYGRQGYELIHKDTTIQKFWMSKYEITNTQFAEFLNTNDIELDGIFYKGDFPTQRLLVKGYQGLRYKNDNWEPDSTIYASHPIIYVTWYGAYEYAKYKGGRLPTHAEWEFACRAGTTTPFNTGNFLSYKEANYNWLLPYPNDPDYKGASSLGTLKVGSFAPNAFGLYDMHGNVFEWCSDQIYDNPGVPIDRFIFKGGSWQSNASDCRSAKINSYQGIDFSSGIGFRIVIPN